ncbi:hypothetical protein DSO57_1009162 [Entomophthora muscae]|uniref:Uncharacterized protein n=1 Tax=Entomophthora muscae TaxID=34485 RepID=A0ACC2T767_9FUNG|nr:hypothetical protein DSO57_1009162 [Entomophthora muscae]
MVASTRLWALLAPLLWWALPFSQQRKLAVKANRTPTRMWYPDNQKQGLKPAFVLASPGKTSSSPGTFKNASTTLKFVAFTLAPIFGVFLSFLDLYVGEDPSHLLHLLKDLSRRAQDLVTTNKNLSKSLTCDDLVFPSPNSEHVVPLEAGAPVDSPLLEVESIFPKVNLPPVAPLGCVVG